MFISQVCTFILNFTAFFIIAFTFIENQYPSSLISNSSLLYI